MKAITVLLIVGRPHHSLTYIASSDVKIKIKNCKI